MNQIIQNIYLNFYYLINRKKRPYINIPIELNKNSKILFLMPDDKLNPTMAKKYLDDFSNQFGKIFLFIDQNLTPFYYSNLNFGLISYGMTSYTKIGLPTKSILRELELEKFDIIINLNLKNSNYLNYIIFNLNPKVSIGVSNTNSDNFYNFQIKVNDLTKIDYIYSEIFKHFNIKKD